MKHRLCKLLYASLLALTLCGMTANIAFADGMILPPGADLGYFQVEYHHVDVSIENSVARTRVDQRFFNPYHEEIGTRYVFPLPPFASIRDFHVQLDGVRVPVVKLAAWDTEMFLRNTVTNQRDPSLLQFFGWEAYAVDLNLPPISSVSMVLEYSETLSSAGDLFHYFYTLSTERYSASLLQDVSIQVDVRVDDGLAAVYSPSHVITTERISPRHVVATYQQADVLPTENFELYFATTEDEVGAGFLTHADRERDGQGHFLFLLSPSSLTETDTAMPKDIVFVIDRSGSMAGEKIEQAKQALQQILGNLGEADRFAIVSFDDRIESPSNELQRVTDRSVQDARSYVSRLYDRNSTDIEGALRRGLDLIDRARFRSEASRMIIFLTDGLPTAGITDEGAIVESIRRENERVGASIHVFGVGYDVNTHLLDNLATNSNGAVTYVRPGENLEGVLTGFYSQIAHPLLTDLELRFEGFTVEEVYPRELPDLFFGSSLAVAGRYAHAASDEVTVRLSGRSGGRRTTQVFHFSLDDGAENPFIPRLWATRRIGELLDEVRVMGESTQLVEEIETLGLRYGIVTPYTTEIVQAHLSGVSSDAFMSLYQQDLDGDGILDINQVSGEATVGARVQNLSYQQAMQSNQAAGSNVSNIGDQSVAQVGLYALDLRLIVGRGLDLEALLQGDWLEENVDAVIRFGSDEYFELAQDATANQIMQAGPNVVFEFEGRIVAIEEDAASTQDGAVSQFVGSWDWLWAMLASLFE
jgi:Ca-activated chloride channel family protein